MRLIDADKWINKLETQMNDKDCPSEIKDYNQLLINEINSEPTAYDVDKVMQRIDNEVPGLANLQIYKIDEIVKAGMKEN